MGETIETWRSRKATPEWVWRGLLTLHASGKTLSEDEYDAACAEVAGRPVGGPRAPVDEVA